MAVRLLPGRVAMKMLDTRSSVLFLPDDTLEARKKQRSHIGLVLAMGAPAQTRKRRIPVPPGFKVGDTVDFVFAAVDAKGGSMTEEARRGEWEGEPCLWIAQEEVIAVRESA